MAATATIDEQDQALVSKPDTLLLYMARRSDLRMVKRSRYPLRDAITGQPNGSTPGEFVGFRDGVFRCPPSGKFKLVDTLDGGEAEVDAAELVQWLDNHRLHGNREEGFWRVDPTAPPVSQEEMRQLMQAAMRLDLPTLERIVAEERDGWGRSAIIDEAQAAVDEIRTHLEAQAAQAETAEEARAAQDQAAPEEPKAKPAKKTE